MMDSWSYVSEGKCFAFEEANSSFDSYGMSKSLLSPSYYENNINILVENRDQVIGELGLIRNSNIEDVLSNKDAGDESSSKLSISSIVESSTRDSFSSLIDLKLGGFFVDHRNNVKQNFKSSTDSSSTPPVKRFRSANSNTKNSFFCQVYGCNKDLSGSKDYHKRHKVCEAHSKTARVTVNGIEQRFCQQCSRFHLLDEFDDGKRSCRKRLAGHNERRRKPQIGTHSGRNGKLLQSYNGFVGDMLNRATLTSGSLGGQYITPNGHLHTEDYEQNDWCKRIKQEDILDFGPPLAIPITGRNLHPKPDYPNFHENGSMNSNGSRYPHDQSALIYGSCSLGRENVTGFDTTLSGTGHALSLLSSQQLSSPSQSQSTVFPVDPRHERMSQMGVSSQACINRVTTQFHSSRTNNILVFNGCNNAADFDITRGTLQQSEFVNRNDRLFCEDGPSTTIDLLQLSSQLQRVECQRQSTGTGFLQMEDC